MSICPTPRDVILDSVLKFMSARFLHCVETFPENSKKFEFEVVLTSHPTPKPQSLTLLHLN